MTDAGPHDLTIFYRAGLGGSTQKRLRFKTKASAQTEILRTARALVTAAGPISLRDDCGDLFIACPGAVLGMKLEAVEEAA